MHEFAEDEIDGEVLLCVTGSRKSWCTDVVVVKIYIQWGKVLNPKRKLRAKPLQALATSVLQVFAYNRVDKSRQSSPTGH